MEHIITFEVAMRRLPLHAAAAASTSASSSTTGQTSAAPAPSPPTTTRATSSLSGDENFKLGNWPGLPAGSADELEVSDAATLRSAIRGRVQQCLDSALAGSTVATYESSLRSTVASAESALDKSFLPLTDEDSFFELFGFLQFQDGEHLHWSKVRAVKAAIQKWHDTRGLQCVLQTWSERMRAFWTGLSKGCIHSSTAKDPISFDDLAKYLATVKDGAQAEILLRNKAMVATAFFGVRRGAEVVAFDLCDVQEVHSNYVQLLVRCQKNDPRGLGQTCVIPHVAALGEFSPSYILRQWISRRRELDKDLTTSKKLFITLTGANKGGAVSRDSLRKLVTAAFGVGTASHSLRRGGAQFFARRGACEDATRQQGGWKTSAVMNSVCVNLSPTEVRTELLRVASDASGMHTISSRLLALGTSKEGVLAQPPLAINPVLALISCHVREFSQASLLESKAGVYLRWLKQHRDEHVRHVATHLHVTIKADYITAQAAQRARTVEASAS